MEHALPRTWSLCMTSENHGTVGPAGCKFSHAPEKHERVQVVEIVASGSAPAPAPVADLAGLARFGFCDINDDEFLERPDGAYFLAHEVEARCASAASVAAQAGQVAVPVEGQVAWSIDLQARLIAISQDIAADDDARQVMAEAACLLAKLTGAAPSPAKESK
ncbi:hypothetical protein IFT68_00775 [Oxalobacteraceae sp. CFBP 13730]|nr:hypothetical protein [Oxalobacteraceae sp. CFBP 13730]